MTRLPDIFACQVDDKDAHEAAYRLADFNQPPWLFESGNPFSSPRSTDNVVSGVPAKNNTVVMEPLFLDYTGRATLALGLDKMCIITCMSAQHQHRSTLREVLKNENVPPALNSGDVNHALGVKSLSLTTTLKSEEKKVERGTHRLNGASTTKSYTGVTSEASALQAKSKEHHRGIVSVRSCEMNIDGELETVVPRSMRLDPKLFLCYVNQNSPFQDLPEELKSISAEHKREAAAIHNLVRTHFGQSISCKSTIDNLRSVLRRNEVDDTSDSSATTVLLASIVDTIHLATIQVDMLERQTRAATARRALVVTRRHEVLLMLPEMMQEQAAMHEFEAMAHNEAGVWRKEAIAVLNAVSVVEALVDTMSRALLSLI
eukprot:CAMPEP_0197574518 /NCGR_PEP_ID=MMETSP1326-20131121/226_1 /TAXON_ID=1155430 /ORGANISM="Genus nov. species nov., Strain RCC2288" /LENGTH=373 /DNA_ID=CAMNT_0043137113 /DNA_START=440 /DNA_END=1563 /DNA_ORIENTATION=-